METSVLYGLKQKQLCFVLRENVNTDPDLQLRLRGHLNTVTGDFEYTGSLQKYFRSGPPVKDQGTQPLRIGAGVGISSSNGDEPYLTATAKKQIALTEGTDTLLSAKAVVSYEPRSGKVNRTAGVKLSRQWLNFTEHQDLQISLGLDVDWAGAARQATGSSSSSKALGGVKPDVYLSVRENNWRLRLRRKQWQLTYDL